MGRSRFSSQVSYCTVQRARLGFANNRNTAKNDQKPHQVLHPPSLFAATQILSTAGRYLIKLTRNAPQQMGIGNRPMTHSVLGRFFVLGPARPVNLVRSGPISLDRSARAIRRWQKSQCLKKRQQCRAPLLDRRLSRSSNRWSAGLRALTNLSTVAKDRHGHYHIGPKGRFCGL